MKIRKYNTLADEPLERVACPLCGNTRLHTITSRGQFNLPCFVSICSNDGLVFLSPRWSKERYFRFYEQEYDDYYRPEVLTTETEDYKYSYIKTICSRLEGLELLRNKSSVLDIGAGMGWFLHYLQQHFPSFKRFSAIESSEHCVQHLKSIVKAEVLASDIDLYSNFQAHDFIIMRHVLEHFINPVEALMRVKSSLTETGIVYIAVPDMMQPDGSFNNYWFRVVHIYYFSQKTLLMVAQKAGLFPIKIVSENGEIWAVFRKQRPIDHFEVPQNAYEDQMLIIRNYWKKSYELDFKLIILDLLSTFLPHQFFHYLKNKYEIFKKKIRNIPNQ